MRHLGTLKSRAYGGRSNLLSKPRYERAAMRLPILLLLTACLAACSSTGGAIPFPAGLYPEQPGDRQKWELLSDLEKRRALSFLSTNSTIHSSLFGD